MNSNIQDQPKIRVVVRKRPMNKKQLGRNQSDVVQVRNGSSVIVRQMKQKVDLTKFIDQHHFNFDNAFDESTNNQTIYQQCVQPIVQCAFLGAKVTCFAYGQTGSGKTYTMNGDPGSHTAGMYILGAQDIFAIKELPEYRHLVVAMSFYEIYCGKLFDLLNNRENLQARQDAKQNVNIIGLTQKKISTVANFMQVIQQGSAVRITSQNSTNADSSRSHAIMQISLLDGKKVYGKISFIDLAGCERGADTIDQSKQTRIDGAEINKSLLALKECIRALDCGKAHTPFRGSKLTMVLKDSFTGFCRTLMIGNISPNSNSCENTLNTLRYADRVKELKKGGGQPVSKEDQLAKELMLPRRMKNKQTVEINSSSESSPAKPLHTAPIVTAPPPPPPAPPVPVPARRMDQRTQQRSHRDASQNHHQNPMNRKQRIPRDENTDITTYQQRRGASAVPRNRNPINTSIHNNLNQLKKKDARGSFNQKQKIQRQPSQVWPKPEPQQMLENSEYNEWELVLEEFRTWRPQHQTEIQKMSGKFEALVNYIMREEIEVLEQHKAVIESQKHTYAEQLKLYSHIIQQDKSNQQFLNYADSLQRLVERRMQMLCSLKNKLSSYKYHLKQHQLCQKKLFTASQTFIQAGNDDVLSSGGDAANLLYEYQQVPSARLFHNYNGVAPVQNNFPSNYNSGNNGGVFTTYPAPYQQQQQTQPVFPGYQQQVPFISDFTSNHSGLVERYGMPGINANQLYQNKSEFF